ncbi:hypothetical protein BTO20_31655 [Mycobacterium dioxanotrophicus]|jgi:GntR family transcriptional regulator|uniref:HTH gntR-type domain-containing protein n=1 Tax=Mycobacterium dioxanotrophicus TaxID=482462 RepID=A0A1Y0CBT0_9MYCO|nr:hypothetical protein BTO20_31655 [Mycobacterium dioxanotrophicus]
MYDRGVKDSDVSGLAGLGQYELDRHSFVPLYYQLQEVLKRHIESGRWQPGDLLPSEPTLAKHLGVSRVVVRHALEILADDNQIRRERGRGTFVTTPKRVHRAGGLSRLLAAPRENGVEILVLDVNTKRVDQSAREYLGVSKDEHLLGVTTRLMAGDVPFAIAYSTFRQSDARWLQDAIQVGQPIPDELTLADQETSLSHSEIVVETSQSGRFDADIFHIPDRSPILLVLCTEFCRTDDGVRPYEIARVEYRGDTIQLRVDGATTLTRPPWS